VELVPTAGHVAAAGTRTCRVAQVLAVLGNHLSARAVVEQLATCVLVPGAAFATTITTV
jgi:hypothetical protein